jgi:hypothetical protein
MSDIQELERDIANSEALAAHRNLALKLSENYEFRKLFHEEYFVSEAARLVQLASDPALTKEQQADALEMAKATGHTRRYLSMIIQMGYHAERELPAQRQALEELRANPDEEDGQD